MKRPVALYNTRTRALSSLPQEEDEIRLYCCGPTVYNFAHIGNLRTYFFEDILRRTLELSGYRVKHVMNITDVGHLQSDADEGDDKMSLAVAREKKSVWDIARFYEDAFLRHVDLLNIQKPHIVCRATEHIEQMQAMIQKLIDNGHAYISDGNVYYDTKSFPTYNDFARLRPDNQQSTDRVDFDQRKRNQQDFALWFSVSKFPHQVMKWLSPWGEGFPGWHIECSAMATHYLGEHFHLHCGGIDHIPVHHTNEIAQSEGCSGCHPWVDIWMHGEFLNVDKGKMSKSSGDFLHLDQLISDGYDPLDYRYLLLTAHYRSPLKFSYEALDGARNTRASLRNLMNDWGYEAKCEVVDQGIVNAKYDEFIAYIADDLATAQALALAWNVARDSSLNAATKQALFIKFDDLFGLNLQPRETVLSPDLQTLLDRREAARQAKDWALSDTLRDELLAQGVKVKDRKDGVDWEFI